MDSNIQECYAFLMSCQRRIHPRKLTKDYYMNPIAHYNNSEWDQYCKRLFGAPLVNLIYHSVCILSIRLIKCGFNGFTYDIRYNIANGMGSLDITFSIPSAGRELKAHMSIKDIGFNVKYNQSKPNIRLYIEVDNGYICAPIDNKFDLDWKGLETNLVNQFLMPRAIVDEHIRPLIMSRNGHNFH